ncbi:G2/M-specific cyclinB [Tieghemostelium lacteum]|uniref:G2/M-specific cyclinB n=1 Tax=Tieghemostelium lacteum TaxID=361077 RepID=A0A152A829_TIELA|nr:G2/M-specific cyclinB [Tieghemostelium lacteum]|eukprot:KYR02275.1 G2/M-specific cyclinB [Tieghemostelium lacteum]
MATLNPLGNKYIVPMDENKIPSNKLVGDKKLKTSSRGALSDVTNNTISSNVPIGKQQQQTQQQMIMPQSNGVLTRQTSNLNRPKILTAGILKKTESFNNVQVLIEPIATMETEQQQDEMMIQEDVQMLDCKEVPENIDLFDANDPQCVGEYVNEIFQYYREKEQVDRINPDYMSSQYQITEKMRAILIDWMMAVHVRFKLLSETYFLSVNIVDRYLAKQQTPMSKLQLVGITAILLACKYEEIYAPQIKDFIETSDNACTHTEVLFMERSILQVLQFNMCTQTPLHFLRRFSKAAGSDSRTHSLSKFLTELAMIEYKMIQYLPSMIAAAAIYVARRMTMKQGPYWNVTLEFYTCYTEAEVFQCAQDLKEVRKAANTSSLKAIKKKYMSSKLMTVAEIPVVDF